MSAAAVTIAVLLLSGTVAQGQNCRTVATVDGTPRPERCVSSFIYNGRRRVGCITDNDPDRRPWCSVEVDADGNHVGGRGRWGHCDLEACRTRTTTTKRPRAPPTTSSSRSCRTVGGNVKVPSGTRCVFPFSFRGVTYNECILVGATDGVPWCSTQIDGSGEHVRGTWAHCGTSCPGSGGAPAATQATRRPRPSRGTTVPTTRAPAFGDDASPGTHLPLLSSNDCQLTTGDSAFIFGGRNAKPFQFPFMVLVGLRRIGTSQVSYGCGGTLINNWYAFDFTYLGE